MKIVVYQDRNLNEKRIQGTLNSIFLSLKEKYNNYDVEYVKFKNFKLIKSDFAIIWNVYCKFKNDTMYRKLVKEFQKKNNDKLIVVEMGFIKRENYLSFGFDDISNFGNYPNFPDDYLRLEKLNVKIKDLNYNKNSDKHILFCSQVPWDTQIQNLDYNKWLISTLKEIKKYSNRKIIFRKHPLHTPRPGFKYFDNEFLKKNNIYAEISTNNLKDDLKNCYCVVAYNSTVLVDSILEGIPIISGSNTSIIYDLSTKKISDIENLTRFTNLEIKKVLSNISYKQWSIEEFKKGEPFKFFFK